MHKVDQRGHIEEQQEQTHQAANNEHEGALGLLPRARRTSAPSIREAGTALCEQMQQAAGLLAMNPISQNNSVKRIFVSY